MSSSGGSVGQPSPPGKHFLASEINVPVPERPNSHTQKLNFGRIDLDRDEPTLRIGIYLYSVLPPGMQRSPPTVGLAYMAPKV
jgi:hypothetical protein